MQFRWASEYLSVKNTRSSTQESVQFSHPNLT
jgi:hypothetical protein